MVAVFAVAFAFAFAFCLCLLPFAFAFCLLPLQLPLHLHLHFLLVIPEGDLLLLLLLPLKPPSTPKKCHPERVHSRTLRVEESKDLRLPLLLHLPFLLVIPEGDLLLLLLLLLLLPLPLPLLQSLTNPHAGTTLQVPTQIVATPEVQT